MEITVEEVGMIDDEEENSSEPSSVFNTGWKNEPTVTDLKYDLQEAQSDHDEQVKKIDVWLDNLNITGAAKRKKLKGRSSHVPKLIRKQAEWRYSALSEPFLSTDDIYNVAPVTYEDKEASIQNGLVLNNQFNTKLKKTLFIDELVRTVVDEGTAIVKVGWAYEYEEYEEEVIDYNFVPTNDPAIIQQYQQIAQVMQSNNPAEMEKIPPVLVQGMQLSQQNGVPLAPVKAGSHTEIKTDVLVNQPTLDICDYNNVIVDPTCGSDLAEANFIIFDFETSLSELKKDGKYHNLDKIVVSDNAVLSEPDYKVNDEEETSFVFKDEPRKKIVAFEYWGYWDVNGTGEVEPIVATWVGTTMIRMEPVPFPDKGLPFVNIQYLPVRRSVYGEPDGELLEENQAIAGAVTRGMVDIMGRSANGQMGSRKDALDLTNKRKFDKGLDYEFNAQADPKQAFHMHTYPEIPQSAQFMLQLQNTEAESLSGVKAFSQGINSQSLGDNVGGIKSAMDATAKREMGILRRVSEGMIQIGRKIVAMNAEFLSDVEVVRVTNKKFVEVRRDDLAGDFDLSLSISTPEADNEKAQELSFMLQTMGPNQDAKLTKMMQVEIARLRKMPALAKQIEDYEPQPDPIEQERRKLENELLKAQIQNELAKAHENQANGELDTAKVNTELAKAKQLSSQADKQDLDFVEQEAGTTQARDVQKMQAQAEAQTRMKVIDNLTKPKKESNT